MKKIWKFRIIFFMVIGLLFSFTIFEFILPTRMKVKSPLDADFITEGPYTGNYLVCDPYGQGSVLILSPEKEIVWKSDVPHFFIHDADLLPNGNIIMTDSGKDRIIEVDINDPAKILWSWDARNSSDINWTDFGINRANWTDLSYVQNQHPSTGYWTHLNDVEFINGTTYGGKSTHSLLISLRNFNLVLQIEYADVTDYTNNTNYSTSKGIEWWYGDPSNQEILHWQHNPDLLDNGNILICDSENRRFIEVNNTTKQVVWDYSLEFPDGDLRWARDCDELGDGTYLVTDSGNARIFILDRDSKQILREYSSPHFILPYEADYLDGKILVSDGYANTIFLLDFESGEVIWRIGFPWTMAFPFSSLASGLIYNVCMFFWAIKTSKRKTILEKFKDWRVFHRIIFIIFFLLSMIYFNSLVGYLWEFGIRDLTESFPQIA